MNWNNVSLVVLGLSAFVSAFTVALWISLVIWTFRDMRSRSRDAFAQLLAALMVLVLGPLGVILYFILRPRETLAEKYERSLEEEALLQDIESRLICPGCKQPIETDFMLCPICHTRLRHPYVHCERLIHPRWNICPYCASSQKPVPGVEKAGRVTLLDLQQEESAPLSEPSGLPQQEDEVESVQALEAEAMRNLARSGYGSSTGSGWGRTESELDRGESGSGDGPEPEPAADQAAQTTEPDQESEDAARRILSLFRRS